jgi:hypothetical protein
MRRSRLVFTLAVSLSLVSITGGAASGIVTLEPVITGKGEQYRAFVNDSYITYTQWNKATGVSSAFARPPTGGTRTKLNTDGTSGITGGFDPGTNRVLYQQYNRRGSDLFFYDLDTGTRSKANVSSPLWEWQPLISESFIVFVRERERRGNFYESLRVLDRGTGTARTIAQWKWDPVRIFVGAAGDRYVTYTYCDNVNCRAYIYDWQTNTHQRIPTVNKKPQYAPIVDEVNSTVYFTRSGPRCGQQVNIWRRPLPISSSDTVTKIVDLPDGIDTGWEASLTANSSSGQMDLYVERYICGQKTGDVYVARGVDAGPVA